MKKTILIAALSCIVLASCVSTRRTIPSGNVSFVTLAPLTPDQYNVTQDTEGQGSASNFFIFGFPAEMKAKDRAISDAIAKIPGADLLLCPRFEVQRFSILGLYTHYEVKVKGKSIQIKTTTDKK
jgi:hypothetical protein